MKVKNLGLTCLLVLSIFVPSSFLTAQQTTTLQAIINIEKEKELQKKELTHNLANPKQENTVTVKSAIGSKQNPEQQVVMTETDIANIQKNIDKKKANLAIAKANKSWSQEMIKEKEAEIINEENDLKWQKKNLTLPVSSTN